MKKVIFTILLVAILALSLIACDTKADGPGSGVYAELNEMVAMDYPIVKLQVETTSNGITLVNKYSATTSSASTTIRYTVQSLNNITVNEDGSYNIPDKMIEEKTGSAIVENGKITVLDGDDENISVEALDDIKIKFDKDYFTSIETAEQDGINTFSAIVSDIKGFTGNNSFDGKDMTIQVSYTTALKAITINYTMNSGATVKVTYSFS